MGPTHRVDANSDSREYIPTADSPFYCFSNPPFRLSFHLCFHVVPVCVSSFPVGFSGPRGLRGGLVERSAPSSVARVCRLTPPCTRTTLCLLSLLHHRRRWVSLTYHGERTWATAATWRTVSSTTARCSTTGLGTRGMRIRHCPPGNVSMDPIARGLSDHEHLGRGDYVPRFLSTPDPPSYT